MIRWCLALAVGVVAACGATANHAIDPTSRRPALRLPRTVLPTGYRAHLAIDPGSEHFRAAIEITAEVRERSRGFWLHGRGLRVDAAVATQSGRTMRVEVTPVGDDLLSLRPATPLEAGPVTLVMEYVGVFYQYGVDGVYRGAFEGVSYVETQFEPLGARTAFPCFDEPDNKVPWQLTLDVPANMVALSNTHPTSELLVTPVTKRLVFAATRPLPSYLVAFAVGPFEIVDAGKTRSGVATRIVALKGRAREAAYAARTANQILALLEDYFGTPYPYDKLDHVARPFGGFSAMENPGLITYSRLGLLFDPDRMSNAQRSGWVALAAHELAHQWFGNSVTMGWWDDIWLNEAFATWLGEKTLAAFEPSWRSDLIALAERTAALAEDSLITARRVREPINDTDDIVRAFDRITYDKGARLIAMFEHRIGPAKFRDAVRAYLAKHKDRNATSVDFFAALSTVAGHDVEPAFRSFLDQPGTPMVRAELRCKPGQPPSVTLRQSRYVVPGSPPPGEAQLWHLPVCVAFERDGARAETCTELTTVSGALALDSDTCPAWWFGNAGGHGYYRVSQPEAAVIALRDHGWQQLTPAERIVAYSDVAAFAVTGDVSMATQLSFVSKLLAERHRIGVSLAVVAAHQIKRLLRPDQVARFDRWVRETFGASAESLSWTQREGENLDSESARMSQVALVADSGDPMLRAQAVMLAKNWRALPRTGRAPLLAIAADADPATFERLRADASAERDGDLRAELFNVIGTVSDPARLRTVLEHASWLRGSDSRILAFSGRSATYHIIADHFREHVARLLARYPDLEDAADLVRIFMRNCEAADRDAAVAFVTTHFAKVDGGARSIAIATENLDQCIAAKALLGPQLDAWLATLP